MRKESGPNTIRRPAGGPPKPWWHIKKRWTGGELPEGRAAETLATVPSAMVGDG